jgi:hypothetical protein
MVLGIGGLSSAVRRNYSIIQQGVAQGLSSKAINEAVRAATGTGIRRTDLLQGMRVAGGVQQAGRNIGNIPFANRPNYATLPAFTPVTSNRKYLIQYRVEWFDPVKQIRGTDFITVGTDQTLTRQELDDLALQGYGDGQQQDHYSKDRRIERLVPMGARQQIIG